jgi:TP901 family phage tail tape measure protein
MSITVDTIHLKFNVTPSYQQQQIQQLNADLKQATANYEALGKAAKDNAKEHSRLYGELSKLKAKRDELTKQKTLTEKQQQELASYNQKIEELTDNLVKNEEQRNELTKVESAARKEMVALQNQMNGVTQSTLRYNMTIQQLNEREKELRMLLNNVDPSTDEWEKYNKELSETKKRIADLRRQAPDFHDELKIEDMTIKQLNERISALRSTLNDCKPNTPEFKEYSDALKETESQLKKVEEEINNTKVSFGKFIEGFNKFAWAIQFAYQGYQKVVQWADQYVQSFAKMDDAMTDVMKYTGQTKAEVEDMNEAFKQMTTRTAREELNALAGAAGRLGIQGKENIIGFVDAADKINVALGDDLGEGAIDQIGKLTMVFGEDKTKGLNGAMLATGSAINVLGASSSAATGFITEFTSDMAGMAVNAHIAQTDIMGYASALSQAGVEGKTASGVFAQMITKMFTDPASFAKAAGLEVKAFTDLLKTDANQAILQFLEGLKAKGGFESLAPALKSLKMQGTQAVPVISSLINKMDELKTAQDTAKKAYDEGTSIIEEFNNANSSAAAKLEIAQKAMNDAASDLGKKLMPIVQTSINAGTASIKVVSSLISFTVQHRTQLIALTATVAMLTTMWKAHTVWLAIVDARNKAAALSNKALMASMLLLRNAGVALHATWALLTKGVEGYTVVMRAARLASLTNPWMALVTVLTVVGVAIYGMTKAWQSHARALREQDPAYRAMKAHAKDMQDINKRMNSETAKEISTIHHLTNVIRSNAYSIDERKAAIKRLEEIVPGYHASINKEGELIETNTNKLKEYINQLKATARAQAYADKLAEIEQEKLDNDLLLSRKQNNLKAVDAELNRGKDTTYKSNKRVYYRPSSTPGISGAEVEVETNERLTNKLKERKVQEDAVNSALKKREELNRREQSLERQMEKDGVVRDVVIKGNTPAPTNTSTTPPPQDSDSERNVRLKKLREKRKELEAEAKQAYEEELLRLKQQYQGRQNLADEWHGLELKAEERYIDRLAQIRTKYGASEADKMEVANKQLDLVTKQANHERELQQKETNRKIEEENRNFSALQIEEARKRLDGLYTDEEAYDIRMQELEIEHQKNILAIRKAAGEDVSAEEKALLDKQYQLNKRKYAKEESDIATSQEDANEWLWRVEMAGESFKRMRELNEEYYRDGKISYQQYEENLSEIAEQESEKRQQIQQAAIDGVSNLLSSASSLFSAMQQRETAAVDAKYKKMIAAAKKQGKDTTKLEEQQEEEKKAIQKKYADRNFKIQVLQIVANTAQGISKTIAEMGMPWAIPFVALTAAAGAMQLASAKAAADQAAGLYEGGYSEDYQEGYTRKGDPKKQAGVIPVHQNEFVANHKAVANPEVRPVLDVIDRHQRAGDIQMLNSTRMLEEAYGGGRYRGGYTQGNGTGIEDGMSPMGGTVSLDEVERLLTRIEQNTGRSLTVRRLRDEIAHEERMEQNARR